ncbi:Transcription initiation factor TFIIIB Bdp1 subunit [Spraguea lophii 42_110]|uniref:Transcription initiation factor TFIIIB Bdp1 subunit n=1 Tax=Spraguea lophii (strain 42_110) TaxID=1358809 RepID=S7XID0_SPRLO|nr:Transcription initiation factor TFIIIB Bdp1 subunit [Spraguea lophii 42_110]
MTIKIKYKNLLLSTPMDLNLSHYLKNSNFSKRIKKKKSEDGERLLDEEIITSHTFRKRAKFPRWTITENELFFNALEICGLEFTLISELFDNKTRKQIKAKYKREEKNNPQKISSIMSKIKSFDAEKYNSLKVKYKKTDNSLNNL